MTIFAITVCVIVLVAMIGIPLIEQLNAALVGVHGE